MSSGSVNKVILIGNLGTEPELLNFEGGNVMCHFTLATNETWKDAKTGDKKEKVEWHKIIVFGKLAEICKQYLDKGNSVYIEGKLQTRKYTDNNDVDHYPVEINASEMRMLGKKDGENHSPASKPALHPDLR